MFFDELSNDEWARLSALVSDEPAVRLNRRGRPRAEPRIVANAVLWILTTGEPWSKLPGRYPSGPTCRRRFEEWQANGTLIEMVRLLSETGRTFAYIPEPTPPAVAKPAPEVEQPKPRDDTVRGVYWKSPESWQTGGSATGVANGWRPLGAMADITRQLAGAVDEQTFADDVAPPAHTDASGAGASSSPDEDVTREITAAHAAHARASREMLDAHVERDTRYGAAYDAASDRAPPDEEQFDGSRFNDLPNGTRQFDDHPEGAGGYAFDGRADGRRFDGGHEDQYERAYAGHTQADGASDDDWGHSRQHDLANYHAPLWMNLAMPGGAQFDDDRGYVIYVVAEQVASSMYRAWAEILRDGRRIERSGLIGPRFEDEEAARRFALEWATEWIDRECGETGGETGAHAYGDDGAAAAGHEQMPSYASVNVKTVSAQQSVVALTARTPEQATPATAPVARAMPESAAVKNALPAGANRNGSGGSASAGNAGNGSATASGAYPQHANAHRVQLRRYPSEGNGSGAPAEKTTDRFPPTRKILSHVR